MRPLLAAIALFTLAPLAAIAPASAAVDSAQLRRGHAVARWENHASEDGQQPAAPPAPSVKVGQRAPDFTLHYLARGADGKYEQKTISLADFKGQKTVILAFFPAAFSPG
jgi:hypothetical protein